MIGKILGGVIGFFTLGFLFGPLFAAVLGVGVGHVFDKGRSSLAQRFDPEQRKRVEEAFFNALFPVLGYLAKADGRVSTEEVRSAEELIARMGLNEAQRNEAIRLFQLGKESGFDIDESLARFNEVCASHSDVKRIFLIYLITLALSDGVFDQSEEVVLQRVSEKIGFSRFLFNQLIGMVKAQMAFRERHGEGGAHGAGGAFGQPSPNQLATAYDALGVAESVSDNDLKRAYRKLMSENHPDKLAGQGVPEEMLKLATERSQEIQSAYEVIKKHRKS